ncbi:MAG: histidine phosphatase family protein [Actinomycetota bacterium]
MTVRSRGVAVLPNLVTASCLREPANAVRWSLAAREETPIPTAARPVAVVVRHGETEWSNAGRHTGRTNLPLNAAGRADAAALAARLAGLPAALILCSPRLRAAQTAEIAGYAGRAEITDDLAEWDYGDYEGMTTAQIHAIRPDWSLWRDGAPGGESPEQIGDRADRVVRRLVDAPGDVLIFAHGHLLRVLAATWLGLPPAEGRLLALSAGSLSVLGWERETPVLRLWNDVAHISAAPPLR